MPNGDIEKEKEELRIQRDALFQANRRAIEHLAEISGRVEDYITLFIDTNNVAPLFKKLYNSIDWAPFEFYPLPLTSAGEDYNDVDTEALEPGYIYHLHNLVGYCEGTAITQCSLGYVSGATFMVMRKRSADNPFETVEYVGDIVLKGTDKIRIRFHNAEDGDKLYLFANGIKRRI